MKHTVEVSGIKLYAFHGCLPEEGKIGGNYIVDVRLSTNFMEAAETDDLSKTIDYVIVNKIVKREMAQRSQLIEHVGQRIVKSIRSEIENVDALMVKITKLCPPINGDVDKVAIIIED